MLLYLQPEMLILLLRPILAYANNETSVKYTSPYSPHQLGVYPIGDATTEQQEQMPIENSGRAFFRPCSSALAPTRTLDHAREHDVNAAGRATGARLDGHILVRKVLSDAAELGGLLSGGSSLSRKPAFNCVLVVQEEHQATFRRSLSPCDPQTTPPNHPTN